MRCSGCAVRIAQLVSLISLSKIQLPVPALRSDRSATMTHILDGMQRLPGCRQARWYEPNCSQSVRFTTAANGPKQAK